MKALYLTWPSARTFDHASAAVRAKAIDTILIACQSVPGDIPTGYFDSYDDHVQHVRVYQSLQVPVYPVVHWQREWAPHESAEKRIRAAKQLLDDTGAQGVVWDVEDYRWQSKGENQMPVPRDFVSKCVNLGVPVVGGMPRALNKVWFAEKTYYQNRWWSNKLKGIGKRLIPGAFLEYHTDPAKYVRKLKRCYKHYWIYSHAALGQRMPDPAWSEFKTREIPLTWWETL